jgi:DNA-binding MarR family transcriptional regulator
LDSGARRPLTFCPARQVFDLASKRAHASKKIANLVRSPLLTPRRLDRQNQRSRCEHSILGAVHLPDRQPIASLWREDRVTDGHGVPALSVARLVSKPHSPLSKHVPAISRRTVARPNHESYERAILNRFDGGPPVTQRGLAKDLGIALGLTNLLIKRLVRKGLVRIIHIRPNRVKYLITPAGIAEKARMSSAYFAHSVRFYVEARDRIQARFAHLSAQWPSNGGEPADKRIVFFGAGEVAEIAYVCLQATDLHLVGIVGDEGRSRFFNMAVSPIASLAQGQLDGEPYGKLVMTAFEVDPEVERDLALRGIPPGDVFWI